jgi:tetratricopeptide (TPR) repeat protein
MIFLSKDSRPGLIAAALMLLTLVSCCQTASAQTKDPASQLRDVPNEFIIPPPLKRVPPQASPTRRAAWSTPDKSSPDSQSPLILPDVLSDPDDILPDTSAFDDNMLTDQSTAIQAEQRRQEKEARYQALQDRLKRLVKDWKHAGNSGSPAAKPTDQTPDTSTAPDSAQSETQPDDSQATPSNDASQAPSSTGQTPPPATSIPSVTTPADPPPTTQQLPPEAIIDGPVDRISLANNLYAVGEYVIALETYSQVDRQNLTVAEIHWINYQMATCLRKLKRIPEAQEMYRRMAGEKTSGWLGSASKWWLDRIDDRARLEQEIEQYNQILESLKEIENGNSGQ